MRLQAHSWPRFCLFVGANGAVGAATVLLSVWTALGFLEQQWARIEASAAVIEQAALLEGRIKGGASLDLAEVEAASRLFVQGDSANLLSADLLTRVRAMADRRGVAFTSIATLPERSWHGRRFSGLRLEFKAPTRQAAQFLLDVEEDGPFFFNGRTRLAASAEEAGAEHAVSATLDVYGATQWPKS